MVPTGVDRKALETWRKGKEVEGAVPKVFEQFRSFRSGEKEAAGVGPEEIF